MRVALVHDWLTGMRGGEKVIEVLCELFPAADLYTLVYLPEAVSPTIRRMRVHASPLQGFPCIARRYRYYLPLMPWAISRFRLDDYDLVISSSHCVAKGVRVRTGTPHRCYCHTPMRYIWDMYDDYFGHGSFPVRFAMRLARGYLRRWDVRTARGVSRFIANSATVRERIVRLYGRDAEVIYPPVDTDFFSRRQGELREDFFLYVGAFAAYKRVDLIIEAFRGLSDRLIIIGGGPEERALKNRATSNITFAGRVDDETIRQHYARARALVFAGLEDFGIVPVEAMACGTPVIAFNKGGVAESVVDGETGVLFNDQHPAAMREAIHRLKTLSLDPEQMRGRALLFSRATFVSAIQRAIAQSTLSL